MDDEAKKDTKKRWKLTGNERWKDAISLSETKEHAAKGEVYQRITKTVIHSVREVELDCGHWAPYRYDGGLKFTRFCVQCDEASTT